MASTLASQLQRIKPFVQGEADGRRPFTRPSVIFDPKEAADIDVETILSIAVSGLEVLIKSDTRFGKYKDTLFSRKSSEFDRETMGIEENKNIDFSIASYLRLLAGYLQLPSALKTLEYLIRRYKVHMYNVDELVLCALPYHDTHAFVRIVQLLDLGNKKWAFLEGVKASGSTLPRKVIVQQCIRDMGVLEDLCNYALPTKKFQHSRPVFCFCSAVLVEALGAIPTLDSDTVKRIIPFVFSGLSSTQTGGPDHKAGAMMIVGVLATRATLALNLIQQLILLIAKAILQDAKESADLPWLHTSVMTIISLVQLQSVQKLSKKVLEALNEIRDLAALLMGLSEEFNIEKFLLVYLEALADYSSSDDSCRLALITTIETIPVKDLVDNIVIRVLAACTKLSQKKDNSKLCESGCPTYRKSTTSYCTFIGGHLVIWRSKMQSIVSRSSAEAKSRPMAHGASEILWWRSILVEVGFSISSASPLYCDNQAAIHIASDSVHSGEDFFWRVEYTICQINRTINKYLYEGS